VNPTQVKGLVTLKKKKKKKKGEREKKEEEVILLLHINLKVTELHKGQEDNDYIR
jgi:hypothetical protein